MYDYNEGHLCLAVSLNSSLKNTCRSTRFLQKSQLQQLYERPRWALSQSYINISNFCWPSALTHGLSIV